MSSGNKLRIAILGASGYTGGELLRLLVRHPAAEVAALTAERHAGETIDTVFPHLAGLGLPRLRHLDAVDFRPIDVVFCALPHGKSQGIVSKLPGHMKIIDLAADFRLADAAIYARTYGQPHAAADLQREAVYGLTELARDQVRRARLIACPGCYPTAANLPLVPLVAERQIRLDDIIIDAKSGVSGAGRGLKETSLFAEVAEGVHAYGVANHRHTPEIEQELSRAAGQPIAVNFTPHLLPINRGILASIYVRLEPGATADDLRATLAERYRDEPFVAVTPKGVAPATRHVRGSNHCLIGVFADRIEGRAILISAIDNLVKGASGQAVQNMNVAAGLAETMGLDQPPLFP
jgi:N-acetyl-gamma-glutamyl-phosphate reductase